ncbi:MAG TPA: hypothetical protein VGD41_15545, partial [Pyrinomonadaceae bacterium]
ERLSDIVEILAHGLLGLMRFLSTRARTLAVALHWLTSLHGTSVWTGRALQVGYDGLEIVGLAHLYSAL